MGGSRFAPALILSASLAFLCLVSCSKRQEAPPAEGGFTFSGSPSSPITFISTQLNPVEEAGKMRNAILKDFPGRVDFRPNDNGLVFREVETRLKANPAESILVGAQHGELVSLRNKGNLRAVDDILSRLGDRGFPPAYLALGRLDGKYAYYVPWMQASFVMAANKKALKYLPAGADLGNLTYAQLQQWATNAEKKTGKKALGFPAGKNGLMHRFFQGFLYPSFTGSTLLKFRSPEALAMWSYFRALWDRVHPGSLVYSTMAEPLLAGDVLIAWDHSARLAKAFAERPDDFVAFPCPKGPAGRGYMLVLAGLALPAASRDIEAQALLIDYLTRPEIQLRTLSETGFFPVVALGAKDVIPPRLAGLKSAVDAQAGSKDAVLTLAPMGLGEGAGAYNNLFMLTFFGIVLEGKDAKAVLDRNALELQAIVDRAKAAAWPPDVSDQRPCRLE